MKDNQTDRFVEAVEEAQARWNDAGSSGGARSNLFTTVQPTPVGRPNPWVSGGFGTNAETLNSPILVQPPAGPEVRGRVAGFEPLRIGYLVDIDTGSMLGDLLDAALLGIEDALNDGDLFRPVEIVPKIARGLPRGNARETIRGYNELVDDGCLIVLGPYITDNGLALLPATEQRHVPLLSTNGSKPFHSKYGFTLGNGGISEEGAIMAGWLREAGYQRIGMVTEVSPGGHEYSLSFRDAATRNGLEVVGEVAILQNGQGLKEGLTLLRDSVKPEALAYCGYGYPTAMFNPALQEIGWDPTRIMSTALMWYINEPQILMDLEGWYGVDQVGPVDETEGEPNPNYLALLDRFEARFGRRIVHAMIPCTYDAVRVAVAALAKAPLLTPEGVTEGIERLTMLPACVGGPRSYIGFGPYDHKGFKGDWLTVRQIVDGRPRFAGYLSALLPGTIQHDAGAGA